MIIYLLTNRANGKYYIGQTLQPLCKRLKQHVTDAERKRGPLQMAIRKYGIDGFDVEILAQAQCVDDLNSLETLWILLTSATSRAIGYNCTTGGLNHIRTEDTRGKLRLIHTGRKQSPETIAKRVASLRGRKRTGKALENLKAGARKREDSYSDEQRRCRSTRLKGIPTRKEPKNKGQKGVQVAWNKGMRMNPALAVVFAEARTKPHSKAHKAKVSATMKGRMPAVNLRRMASKLAAAEAK